MKRLITIISFFILGFLIGVVIMIPQATLDPPCGEAEVCLYEAMEAFWPIGTSFIFAIIGFFWSKPVKQGFNYWAIRIYVLCTIMFVMSSGLYIFRLKKQNAYLYSIREMQPSLQLPQIVITKANLQVYDINSQPLKPLYKITPWQRCVMGVIDKENKITEISCRNGYGVIKNQDLNKLIKFPMDESLFEQG